LVFLWGGMDIIGWDRITDGNRDEGYLFRATSGGIGRVAGLAPIEDIEGVENVNVTDLVEGHMAYRQAIPKLLRRVGWIVVDDEFQEIEEPVSHNSHLSRMGIVLTISFIGPRSTPRAPTRTHQ